MFKKILSVIMLELFLLSIFVSVLNVQPVKAWTGTVYIRADGAIDPLTAPMRRDGDLYTLSGNITGTSDSPAIIIQRDNMTLDGAGYTIQETTYYTSDGVRIAERVNVTVKNMRIRGFNFGIYVYISSNLTITENDIIVDWGKSNIMLYNSSYNRIVGNNLTNSWTGIYFNYDSNNNLLSENWIGNNSGGVGVYYSSNNVFWHNKFMRNRDRQADTYDSANIWDDGYPSGGNLWSDYWGGDSYSGPYQNETGSDGIGDTPRIIDENNVDRYPLAFSHDPCEQQVVSLVNGSRAYNYDLGLENIALGHYAFRSGGSAGANETANWIRDQFSSLGLEAWLEPFEFTTWDLLSKPSLVIDDDGNPSTTYDQTVIPSFQCEHFSWPTPPTGAFADLVILPLPEAASYFDIGVNPINTTAWNAINTTGKIVLIGREVRWSSSWHSTYKNKLTAQPPKAVVYTWWYDWMSFTPPMYSSAGGRPISSFGDYYWDLGVPVGFVNYEDGLWIRSRESSMDVSANVSVRSVIGTGTHYNVVGRIRGYINPEKTVIISSHYDTVMCSGFCDNGAGTAGVLELAKVFAEAVRTGFYKPAYTLLFVAFTSEELYLVGSINYIKQHKSEMANIKAVVNLDCIGSDEFRYTETESVNGFDLDQIILEAAGDIGVPAEIEPPGGSDDESFRDPSWANSIYSQYWGLNANISDAYPVQSSALLISYPLLYDDFWYMGTPGWIHTEYDNSTSTSTLDWVEVTDLENHIKIAALTVVRVVPNVPPSPRNLAVVNVVPRKTIVGQTYSVRIDVTIENQGGYIEYCNVTVYANATSVATIQNVALKNGTSTTVFLRWNTTGFAKGNYTIRAYVTPVQDETNTEDNTLIDGTVIVGIPGDVNSDGKVDMKDIGWTCYAYGSYPGHPRWNPNADVNDDDKVDMRDIGITCKHYGQIDP